MRLVLVVPFVLLIVVTAGTIGTLSLYNGQRAVSDLVTQSMIKLSTAVEQQLNSYAALTDQITQQNADLIEIDLLDLEDLDKLGQHFWMQAQRFPDISYIYYTSVTGQVVGAGRWLEGEGIVINEISPRTANRDKVYRTDNRGNRIEVIDVYDYDPLADSAYQRTIQLNRANWTELEVIEEYGNYAAVNFNRPIFNQDETLVGVIAVDLLVAEVSHFLRDTQFSPFGRIFVMQRDGLLVGQSISGATLTTVENKPQILHAIDSPDFIIRTAARHLQNQFGSFENIREKQSSIVSADGKFLSGMLYQRQFVEVFPWQDKFGLDWLVVITMPESVFSARIVENNRMTVLLCLSALVVAIFAGIYTSRWITEPIWHLRRASEAIASGELRQTIGNQRIYELEKLAESFNKMAKQLQESFTALERLNIEQDQRVKQRTLDLAQANKWLQNEIHERKQVEQSLEIANQELRQLARLDGLTRIANRRWFDEWLLWEWQRLAREQLPLSLILIDVDDFKQYNDCYGHQLGDECLIQIAQSIVPVAERTTDLVARYGGEEFAVILPDTAPQGAIVVAEQIQQNIWALKIPHKQSRVRAIVSVSLGVASLVPKPKTSPVTLLKLADQALYTAKRQGRDRYAVSWKC